MAEPLRVVLMSYAPDGFRDLHEPCAAAGHQVVGYVHTPTGRPAAAVSPGRAQVVGAVVEAMPRGTDLSVVTTGEGLTRALAAHEPDVVVCNGFPWRVPGAALRVPRLGVLNIHPSLLPRHRGPMPVHWAVRHGDPETGVTVHLMAESFDAGPIIAQRGGVPLPDQLDGETVYRELQDLARELLPEALSLVAGGFRGVDQDEAQATYEAAMGPETAVIDRTATAAEVHHLVRAYRYGLFPVPGPLADLDGRWVCVLRTRLQPGEGVPLRCADGPVWVVESCPVPPRTAWLSEGTR